MAEQAEAMGLALPPSSTDAPPGPRLALLRQRIQDGMVTPAQRLVYKHAVAVALKR
jgi:hypothetical protein